MTKFGKLITAFFLVVAIGGGAYYFMSKGSGEPQKTGLPDFDFGKSFNTASANPDISAYPDLYDNMDYGFMFSYPDGFDVKEIDEDNGAFTVLAEGPEAKTFQIFIQSFDEEGPLTPERIKKDIPEMNITASQQFDLSGAPALAFQTDSTVEVWFVYGGFLYQVTALKDFTDDLSKILATWRFI